MQPRDHNGPAREPDSRFLQCTCRQSVRGAEYAEVDEGELGREQSGNCQSRRRGSEKVADPTYSEYLYSSLSDSPAAR